MTTLKTVYLVRHAKSSWDQPGLKDHDRPLNERGKRDAPRMADWVFGKGADVEYFLSSTAKRAHQTALKFAAAFGLTASEVVTMADLYHASEDEITEIIRGLPDEVDTVMLFAHNPGLTDFFNLLPANRVDNVPTCGVYNVQQQVDRWEDFDPAAAHSTVFFYPKQLK